MTDRPRRPPPGRALTRRTLAARFRTLYGESPLHLLVLLASFAVCGYAAARLLERDWFEVAKWVVLAAVVHDLVLVPLYAGTDWLLHKALRAPRPAPGDTGPDRAPADAERGGTPTDTGPDRLDPRVAAVNHVRVPAFLSLLMLLVYWPLITNDPRNYRLDTALTPGVFMGRWLLITAVLFGASAALFCLRRWRSGRRTRAVRTPRERPARPSRRPR
jgi:hypothetical protein